LRLEFDPVLFLLRLEVDPVLFLLSSEDPVLFLLSSEDPVLFLSAWMPDFVSSSDPPDDPDDSEASYPDDSWCDDEIAELSPCTDDIRELSLPLDDTRPDEFTTEAFPFMDLLLSTVETKILLFNILQNLPPNTFLFTIFFEKNKAISSGIIDSPKLPMSCAATDGLVLGESGHSSSDRPSTIRSPYAILRENSNL
jgi:hypothetical protein